MNRSLQLLCCLLLTVAGSSALAAAPRGEALQPEPEEAAALARLRGKVNGHIVWSTSRVSGLHDIWIMNADGTGERPVTDSRHVDWFPRLSPDGQTVLFVRSKRRWESELNANRTNRWEVWTIGIDGSEARKVAGKGSWATWIDADTIGFVRNDDFVYKDLKSGRTDTLIGHRELGDGWIIQQPTVSPQGDYVSITARGRARETGVFSMTTRRWNATGEGCQINWFPDGKRLYWVNQSTGIGGTELFSAPFADGKLADDYSYEELQWFDLPRRHSHEYFPKLSPQGTWLVWCATARGHDHDIYDYELFLKRTEAPIEAAVRLSFHSGNDRWPDIWIEDEAEGDEDEAPASE